MSEVTVGHSRILYRFHYHVFSMEAFGGKCDLLA